jgi:hypothetical protein
MAEGQPVDDGSAGDKVGRDAKTHVVDQSEVLRQWGDCWKAKITAARLELAHNEGLHLTPRFARRR